MVSPRTLRKLKDAHQDDLLALPNVTGVGIGRRSVGDEETDDLAIVVTVEEKVPEDQLEAAARVPRQLSGTVEGQQVEAPTDVIVAGRVHTLGAEPATDRSSYARDARPIQPGYSIGPQGGGTGTLGCFVVRKQDGNGYALSCHHVLFENALNPTSTPIFQASDDDTGGAQQRLGDANWWAILKQGAVNYIDAGLSTVNDYGAVDPTVPELGSLKGAYDQVWSGWEFRKIGRTTGNTLSKISSVDYTTTVNGYSCGPLRFEKQCLITGPAAWGPIAKGGDSGSVFVTLDTYAGMLLFGASDDGLTVVATPIKWVLDVFGAQIWSSGRGEQRELAGAVTVEGEALYDPEEENELLEVMRDRVGSAG